MNKWTDYFFNNIKKYNINIKKLSANINIIEDTIENNKEYNWNIRGLCINDSISYKYLENIIKNEKIDYTEDDLFYYQQNICKKSSYTIEDALKNDALKNNNYDISKLSLNNSIKWQDIENYQNIYWQYGYLSRNKNIKLNNILENMNRGWDFGEIVRNPIFHISNIKKNKTLMRRKNEYFENPNFDLYEYITECPIQNYKDINRSIHDNENFNIKMLNDIKNLYPEFIFDYGLLGNKKNIDFNYILSHNENWDILYLSLNPNISFELIDNNQYDWDFNNISLNTFDKERNKYLSLLN
jgi:hypothetical protein